LKLPRRSRADDAARLRIYYASDVHGSDVCWRKFLNAARYYDVAELIMGGDLAGKALVPIVRGPGGEHRAQLHGEERVAHDLHELEELERAIRTNGFYPLRLEEAELRAMEQDPELAAERFERVIVDDLRAWVRLADQRLADAGAQAYVMAGNDDPWSIDAVLEEGERVVACDDRVERLGAHEMISCSYANRTPWNSARELDEDALYARLRALADQLEAPERAIFNLHVPPYDSGLDTACELDEELRPVLRGGKPHEIPVGSHAVRQIIEEVQPLVSLHGHIHESRAIGQIGRTVAINPGSDYGSGLIHGCVVELQDSRVADRTLVSG